MPRRPSEHVDDPAEVGRRLREARERAGLTQRELSFPGCTTAYISRIESGARIPSLQILRKLGQRLGVSADYLAGGEESGGALDAITEAELALRFGDADGARDKFAAIAETADDPHTRARAIAGLGHVAFDAGDHETAIEHFEEALALSPQLEQDQALTDSLGRAYGFTSRFEEAIGLFERRLATAEESQDLLERLRFSVLLANTLADRGRFGRAEELVGRALALADSTRDPFVRARVLWTQSRLHVLQNDSTRAERYARLALDAVALTEHTRYSAMAHHMLAHIKIDQGKPEDALEILQKGFPLVLEGGNGYEVGLFLVERARALADLDRLDEAEETADEAIERLEGSRGDAMRATVVLARVSELRGDIDRAVELYTEALAAPELTSRYRVETLTRLAELLRSQGRTEDALDVLTQALSLQAETALD